MFTKVLNQVLACLVSLLMVLVVIEAGVRLLGYSPRPTMNRFDPVLGWTKTPNADIRRTTDEFDVRIVTNSRGLREPESVGYAKPVETKRVLMVGDSFTLGYTVPESETIARLLGQRLAAEGRAVQVLNGGTEGWSTDQEVLWLAAEGARYSPDIVVLQMYENDIFWNARDRYLRYPKARLSADGSGRALGDALVDPGLDPWIVRSTALGTMLSGMLVPPELPMLAGGRGIPAEWGVRLADDAIGYSETANALRAFRAVAERLGATALVLVIPDKAQVDPAARRAVARGMQDARYDADRPYRSLVEAAGVAGLPVVAPLDLMAKAGVNEALYFARDWHTNAVGNRVLAGALAAALAGPAFLGPPPRPAGDWYAPRQEAHIGAGASGFWLGAVAVWLVLGTLYRRRFPEQGVFGSYAPVGLLVAAVVAILYGVEFLVDFLPLWLARWVPAAAVGGLLSVAVYFLRSRIPVMIDLFATFVRRGQWYVLPVLAGLLSVGGLLVVAASSPWLAPFIYTLF